LQLCLNEAEAGCTPGSFAANKRFAASGHCGPVRKLQVTSSGTSSVCGSFTGVTVRTRSSGKKKGQCTIRAAARTAKSHARADVEAPGADGRRPRTPDGRAAGGLVAVTAKP